MASLNRVVLIGNLTRDPELKTTPKGTSVANLGLAVNRRWTNQQGEKVDNTDFFNIVVWAKLAELCNEYVKKGSPIAVEGRLQHRTWETPEGQKRSTVEVVAENVQFLGRPQQAGKGFPQTTDEHSNQPQTQTAEPAAGSPDIQDSDVPF